MTTFSASQIATENQLIEIGVRDARKGLEHLDEILHTGIPVELFKTFVGDLRIQLALVPNPDLGLENLAKFVAASRNPLSMLSIVERDKGAFAMLLYLLGASRLLSRWLIEDPDAFDLLRLTEGQPVSQQALIEEIKTEIEALNDRTSQQQTLLRHKKRELLRIAYGHLIRRHEVSLVTEQISFLADGLTTAALSASAKTIQKHHGIPRNPDGDETRMVLLGLGNWGGLELDYDSKLQTVLLYECEGRTDGNKPLSNQAYFERLADSIEKMLSHQIAERIIYEFAPLARSLQTGIATSSLDQALNYYASQGRTSERQQFVKARFVCGNRELGNEFLSQMQRWIYRRYLSLADIAELKALKRRIESRARQLDQDHPNLSDHGGGTLNIEFAVQFLQLLNGSQLPHVQAINTLDAIERLGAENCLNEAEKETLQQGFTFLKEVHLFLQILFESSTTVLPSDARRLQMLARSMRFHDADGCSASRSFLSKYHEIVHSNGETLNRLLRDAFSKDATTDPAIDLILDPAPTPITIVSTLEPYGFKYAVSAYENLTSLGKEQIPFLSTRRCRYFLSEIASTLLQSAAKTPDPDATLANLVSVSDSLGGKGVLWELFSFNQPTLELYVRLCSSSSYLAAILTSNPGMLDDLMDSLVRNKLPSRANLEASFTELVRNADDLVSILHNFKNAQHLSVGVRDILGKEDIQTTTRFLADVAELCLRSLIDFEFAKLTEKYGIPYDEADDHPVTPILLATGKLGGREPNYHSNFDLILLYRTEGATRTPNQRSSNTTSNQHFFHELAQQMIKRANAAGPFGVLYEVGIDPNARVESGRLAISIDEFENHFRSSSSIEHSMGLCKARSIAGNSQDQERVEQVRRRIINDRHVSSSGLQEIFSLRKRLENGASAFNLKRSPGGTLDIEFIVQALQLAHGHATTEVLEPGTIDGLNRLQEAGVLAAETADQLIHSYRFLRNVEARLRLMNTTARHDLPTEPHELRKLAFLLGIENFESLQTQFKRHLAETRRLFNNIFEAM